MRYVPVKYRIDTPENTRLHLLFSLGILVVEMLAFKFLSQHRDTQPIFYLLNNERALQNPFNKEKHD